MNLLSLITPGNNIALKWGEQQLSYQQLISQVTEMADFFCSLKCTRIGLYGDNSISWMLADMAALEANITLVPVPMFFSDEQIQHSVHQAELEVVLTIKNDRLDTLFSTTHVEYHNGFKLLHLQSESVELPDTAKITYTSGSTGRPKGACLSQTAMVKVAKSLAKIVAAGPGDIHLCLLPLSTLLENVAGVYSALLCGATVIIPPQEEVGLSGSSQLQIDKMFASLEKYKANTAIMTPQLLQILVFFMAQKKLQLPALKFLAVGGSTLSAETLLQSRQLGLPVYEGYGLSEACSVVCCNEPLAQKKGSIGKVLPHAEIRIADDGEILVKGATFNGYLGLNETTNSEGYWPTGDLGHIDDEGYVFIKGRKKNLIISSFGRNIAPEWIESELTTTPSILQAAVFGDSQPYLIAVVFSMNSQQALQDLHRINQRLPDYAQVKYLIFSEVPFDKENKLLTENGRIKRHNIQQDFESRINQMYTTKDIKESCHEL